MGSIYKDWLKWLYLHRQGDSIPEIMEATGKAQSTIYAGIQRARDWLQRQAELQSLSEGEILLLMLGVSGRQCEHSRPIAFSGTVLCIDCWHTNNPDRREFKRGKPIVVAPKSEQKQADLPDPTLTRKVLQPKGVPKFRPRGAKT